jgi:hypothetical protein
MKRLYQQQQNQYQQTDIQNSNIYSQQQCQQINSQMIMNSNSSGIVDSLKETQMRIHESAFLINQ